MIVRRCQSGFQSSISNRCPAVGSAARRQRALHAAAIAAAVLAPSAGLAGVTVINDSYTPGTSWAGTPAVATLNDNLAVPPDGVRVLVSEGFEDSRVEAQTFKPATGFTLDKISIFYAGGSGDGGFPTVSLHLYDLNNIDVSSPNTITGYDLDLASSAGEMLGGGAGLPFFVPGAGSARILTFDFDGADQVTLLANHLYAFEIRGTSGLANPMFWSRLSGADPTGGDPYTNGNGYFVAQNIDPDTTLAPRGRLSNLNRDFLMAVYAAVTTVNATWTGTTDNTWSNAGNWTGGLPDGIGHTANFGAIVSGQFNVAVAGGVKTVGAINFDNATSYNIGSSGQDGITMQVATGQAAINVVTGSHTIGTALTLASDTTATVTPAASTLTVSNLQSSTVNVIKAGAGNLAVNNVRASSLSINAGTATVSSNGGDAGTSKVGALTIAGGATPTASLDLSNNDMIVGSTTPMSTIEAQVKNARNGGNWNQQGITSSTARALGSSGITGLGVMKGADYTLFGHADHLFDGQSYADADTLVKYTYNGDANFTGNVNFDDYVRIDTGFNTNLTGWSNGDFNYTGTVNFDDYVMIDTAFNTQGGTLGRAVKYLTGEDRSGNGMDNPALLEVVEHFGQFGVPYAAAFLAAVPEPASLALLLSVPVFAGMRRRRHRNR